MASPFHEGEIALQERSGQHQIGQAVGRTIRDHMPPAAQEFVRQLPFVVVGAEDSRGDVWATQLVGEAGFVRSRGDQQIIISGGILPDDPLADSLHEIGRSVGMLGIEFDSRRRMRVNGRVECVHGDEISISTEEVYANCPQYIQTRRFVANAGQVRGETRHSAQLDDCQRGWIEGADTFFIATVHPERGADCSHRGGMPGFVKVHDGNRLSFPDYVGNFMFQTLGNLERDSRAGLVFPDYESGTLVHLTGRARVDWDAGRRSEFEGAERLVDYEVTGVIERPGVFPLSGAFVDYSRFNPGTPGDLTSRQSDTRPWSRSIGGCESRSGI